MLKLDTPITISPDVYDGLLIVRCEFDLRTQSATLYLAPVRSDVDNIYLGTEEVSEETREALFPEIVRSLTISQNWQEPDPVVAQLMRAFVQYAEALEQVLIGVQENENGLATLPVQKGTRKWSLACTFEPLGERAIAREVRDLRRDPRAKEEATR